MCIEKWTCARARTREGGEAGKCELHDSRGGKGDGGEKEGLE